MSVSLRTTRRANTTQRTTIHKTTPSSVDMIAKSDSMFRLATPIPNGLGRYFTTSATTKCQRLFHQTTATTMITNNVLEWTQIMHIATWRSRLRRFESFQTLSGPISRTKPCSDRKCMLIWPQSWKKKRTFFFFIISLDRTLTSSCSRISLDLILQTTSQHDYVISW